MITDREPPGGRAQREFRASDEMRSLELPDAAALQALANALAAALKAEDRAATKRAGEALLAFLAAHYGVSQPALVVLGSRPKKSFEGGGSYELFGDYTFESERIRV